MRICHNIQGNVAYVRWFVLSIVMMMNAVLANSHLCSFVLTQFCSTHAAAHLIFFDGGINLEILIAGACGLQGSPFSPSHPFHRADTPFASLCPL